MRRHRGRFLSTHSCFGTRLAPLGVSVRNPAFDITPNELVASIITDQGVATAPYGPALAGLVALSGPVRS